MLRVRNHSPWLEQLERTRKVHALDQKQETDVAIVGAGIAGVTTAYFVLKNTKEKVILLEGNKVAHGATGHNAGQIVSYFERQVSGLVKEYGLGPATDAQRAIDSAWEILADIYRDAKLETPIAKFTGYAGCQDLAEILVHLENIYDCQKAHITFEPLFVASESDVVKKIPKKYKALYTLIPQKEVSKLLETQDPRYIAVLSGPKGCLNSALFCEELVAFLLKKYASRFSLYEGSHVRHIYLDSHLARLKVLRHEIIAKKVVLCTNGFERFTITNLAGRDIDTKFHHLVKGSMGFMAGYIEKLHRPGVAISYLPKNSTATSSAFDSDPYFYLTRRSFELEKKHKVNLICIGGPEKLMENTNAYSENQEYSQDALNMIDAFLHTGYQYAPQGKISYTFLWHGLMGYTPNGVRCIGPEPLNPILYYNLGCNGIGILPSLYGSKKISLFLRGDKLKKSIFDPKIKV